MSYEIHIWPKGTKNKTMYSKGFKWFPLSAWLTKTNITKEEAIIFADGFSMGHLPWFIRLVDANTNEILYESPDGSCD